MQYQDAIAKDSIKMQELKRKIRLLHDPNGDIMSNVSTMMATSNGGDGVEIAWR